MKANLKKSRLDEVIDLILYDMSLLDAYSDEYEKMAINLEKLLKAKSYEQPKRISPDTIAIVIGNLIGIVLVLRYEKIDIITSKAFNLLLRGRV